MPSLINFLFTLLKYNVANITATRLIKTGINDSKSNGIDIFNGYNATENKNGNTHTKNPNKIIFNTLFILTPLIILNIMMRLIYLLFLFNWLSNNCFKRFRFGSSHITNVYFMMFVTSLVSAFLYKIVKIFYRRCFCIPIWTDMHYLGR